MADSTTIGFLRVDLPDDEAGQPQSLLVHTGLGTLYPKTSRWSDYLGVGEIISVSSVTNDSSTAAAEFSVELVIPNLTAARQETTNLFDTIRATSLENRDVCLHAVDIPAGAATLPNPQLLLLGKVANVELAPAKVQMRVYTAATLLNQVVGGPSRYTDITHRRFVDAEDAAMIFQNDTSLRNVQFP